jgi:hypothetical protein
MKQVTKQEFLAQSESYFVCNRYRGDKFVVCKKANETTVVGYYQNHYDYDTDCLYFEMYLDENELPEFKVYDYHSEEAKQHPLYNEMLECSKRQGWVEGGTKEKAVLDLVFEFMNEDFHSDYLVHVGEDGCFPFCYERPDKKLIAAIDPNSRRSLRNELKEAEELETGDPLDFTFIMREVLTRYLLAVLA